MTKVYKELVHGAGRQHAPGNRWLWRIYRFCRIECGIELEGRDKRMTYQQKHKAAGSRPPRIGLALAVGLALMCWASVAQAAIDPIPGVDIIVKKKPGGIIAADRTDKNGSFEFKNLPEGNYELTIPGKSPIPLRVGPEGKVGGNLMQGSDGKMSIFDRWGNIPSVASPKGTGSGGPASQAVEQHGRMLTDADWNELDTISSRGEGEHLRGRVEKPDDTPASTTIAPMDFDKFALQPANGGPNNGPGGGFGSGGPGSPGSGPDLGSMGGGMNPGMIPGGPGGPGPMGGPGGPGPMGGPGGPGPMGGPGGPGPMGGGTAAGGMGGAGGPGAMGGAGRPGAGGMGKP